MGMAHLRRNEVPLEQLVAEAGAIALVHPADPPQLIEEVVVGGPVAGTDPDGPPRLSTPAVRWLRVHDRARVDAWLRAPLFGAAPDLIEIASPQNVSSSRDAHDAAHGMLGHVHHVVVEHVLVGIPDAWREVDRAGPRIAFLQTTSTAPGAIRFGEPYGGLSLPVAATERVRALLPKPRGKR
ncbi:MAG: hypothetical protein U1F43_03595 [Myxococcota bacterium]